MTKGSNNISIQIRCWIKSRHKFYAPQKGFTSHINLIKKGKGKSRPLWRQSFTSAEYYFYDRHQTVPTQKTLRWRTLRWIVVIKDKTFLFFTVKNSNLLISPSLVFISHYSVRSDDLFIGINFGKLLPVHTNEDQACSLDGAATINFRWLLQLASNERARPVHYERGTLREF